MMLLTGLMLFGCSSQETSAKTSETPKETSKEAPSSKKDSTSANPSTPLVTKYKVTGKINGESTSEDATLSIKGTKEGATEFEKGETITIEITLAEGKYFAYKSITATAGNNTIALTEAEKDKKYTFVMPESAVTVSLSLTNGDKSFDVSKLTDNEAKDAMSDGFFTAYKDAANSEKSVVSGTNFKFSGNSEFGKNKHKKYLGFKAEKKGRVKIKWKSGTKTEKHRIGYLIKLSDEENDFSVKNYIGKEPLQVDESGNALWMYSEFILPEAGRYAIGANASFAIERVDIQYDETIKDSDIPTVDETMPNADEINAEFALPTSPEGYASEKVFGNFTFQAGVQATFYGKIDSIGSEIYYNCFELQNDETVKYQASGAGTISFTVTGRTAKTKDESGKDVFATSSFTCKDAQGKDVTGTNTSNIINATKEKKFTTVSFNLTAEGTYTFTAGNVLDIYLAKATIL